MGKMAKGGYGNFEDLVANYAKARKGVSMGIIDYIHTMTGKKRPRILDVACGTGAVTRQIHAMGAIVKGTDVSAKMINAAKLESSSMIEYQTAPAAEQPFPSGTFDAVTVFSAFHWFANPETLGEFKRILKPGGMLIIVNKNEVGGLKKKLRNLIRRTYKAKLPNAKASYRPNLLLATCGFREIKVRHFPCLESFSKKQALEYFQSVSLWNLVPQKLKPLVLNQLRSHTNKIASSSGFIERILDIAVISGKSPDKT